MKPLCSPLLLCCGLALAAPSVRAEDAFALRDGDRVVLVGNTLIEREQRYGYWETALTRRYPDKSITFRNLGWSGDTVFGDARAGFGTQADGFRQLKEHVLALKPTVLIIGYGANESFEGPKGLPRFVKGLETLLDVFAPTKARVVLLSPLKQENLGPPLPDPKENNKNLRLYADAIRDVAKKRGHFFVDLYELLCEEKQLLTDNGIHLTASGYWHSAAILEEALGLPNADWLVEMNAKGKVEKAEGARVDKIATGPLRFEVASDLLPFPPPPQEEIVFTNRVFLSLLRVKTLPAGEYILRIDGTRKATMSEQEWAEGLRISSELGKMQVERLRQAIVAKNRLYFYRWRPENETYLFGFRKHEQGQNAHEIPKFDPLIAEKEKEIAKLRVPVTHTYELKMEKKP
ncbi:MAG TPA: SGNH/GDSL hydrolase family protein [Gemmataceae bacterium]